MAKTIDDMLAEFQALKDNYGGDAAVYKDVRGEPEPVPVTCLAPATRNARSGRIVPSDHDGKTDKRIVIIY